jgi:hypothetical protein
VFTQEIYQQMVATMKEVTDSIFNFVSASLSNVFEDFRARVGKERATATDLVNKTKQIIEQKLRMTDVKEAFDAIEDLDSEFRKKLHTVKTMLSERSNAPLHPPSRTKSNPHQKAQPLGNDGPDAEGRNSGRGGRGRGGRAGHTSPSPEKIAPLDEMFDIHHTNLIFVTFFCFLHFINYLQQSECHGVKKDCYRGNTSWVFWKVLNWQGCLSVCCSFVCFWFVCFWFGWLENE